jgi:hypothetical protein
MEVAKSPVRRRRGLPANWPVRIAFSEAPAADEQSPRATRLQQSIEALIEIGQRRAVTP